LKLVNNRVLKDGYDVIVVGAGLGGMTAASLLAKRGLSVLMIDRQDKPGGSCTSFRRDGVTYDVGTAMLYGFGENGFKPFRFLMNELEEPVEVVKHATLARMTFEGHTITFWPEVERFLQELDPLFPEEKEGLRAFYRDLYELYEHIVIKNEVIVPPSEYNSRQGMRSLRSGPLKLLRMVRLLSTSTRSLLDRYFHTPDVINFFDKLCSAYCYCTADETPAVLAATMFLDNHIGGVYYPAGGAQMLPNKIEKAFERLGGQALYRTHVDEILIRNGRARGVRLGDGTEIAARCVVANATVWNLYGKLVRPEHIKPERLAWAQNLVPTFPSMTLYMLVDRSALPEDILPWEVFIENRAVIDSQDLTLYVNALVDETLGPPGKLVITAIAPNLEPWPAPGSPEDRSKAYHQQKQAETQKMLDQIEQHFPGFCAKIETLITGTPTTIERFLLKNRGAVGGPKNAIGQEMLKRLHARSDWKNLYVCGDSTVMATGAPATVVSGVGAANVVLRDLHLPDYDTRPFPKQYVEFVQTPYHRPEIHADEPLSAGNAWLAAAQCQGCLNPACVRDCPAGIDIPGVLRRMEAGNTTGAARELHRRSLTGGLCGADCPAPCEQHCYRRSFTGDPVRIADLMRWVDESAGEDGWLRPDCERQGWHASLPDASLQSLSTAYYLRLAGCAVDVYDCPAPDAPQPALALRDMLQKLGMRFHPDEIAPAGALAGARPGLSPAQAVAAGRQAAFNLAAQEALQGSGG